MSISNKKYRLDIGEPKVIAQGEYTSADLSKTWGYMQFPNISRSPEGALRIYWALRPDTIDACAGKTHGAAISYDNGETWQDFEGEFTSVRGVKMSNGKIYQGFYADPVTVDNFFDNYTPAVEIKRRGINLYRADEIPEISRDYKIIVYDPETKTTTYQPAKVNWPHAPACVHSGNRHFPIGRRFAYLNDTGITAVGDTLYHCLYSYGFDSNTGALSKYTDCINVYFFRSDDFGATWDYVSQIDTIDEIYDISTINAEGFNETALIAMPDDSLVAILRSGSGRPCYIARSTDGCKTWSDPVMFDKVGVYPHMMRLGCGVTVASYGRPGVFVRMTSDPTGIKWEESIQIPLSPCPASDPFLHDTCAYTDMIAIDDHTYLMVYSDFNLPNKDGEARKAILLRKITVIEE